MNTLWSPITEPIAPRKQAAKRHWGSHPYFTKRAWNVVQAYIAHYSHPNEIVLDPFGGGGVTLVESLVLQRRAIHVDVSPLSNFIARSIALSPVDLAALDLAFFAVEQRCAAEIGALRALDDAAIANMRIPGWYPTDSLPRNADVQTVDQLFTRRNLMSLVLLRQAIEFTPDTDLREILRFTFSSTLNKVNRTFSHPAQRKASRGDSGIMRHYRYWIPRNPVELDVWEQFSQRFRHVRQAKHETNQVIGSFWRPDTAQIFQRSATRLTDFIPRQSVDYVFTDPPYGAHIAYLDLATMWTAWLGLPIADQDRHEEMIVGGDLQKSMEDYSTLLQASFHQLHQVLKPDCALSIVFAHKDLRYWAFLMDAALTAGFEYVVAVPQVSYQTSWHKRDNPWSVLSGEIIVTFLNASQPAPRPTAPPNRAAFLGALGARIHAILQEQGGSATHDDVMSAVVHWLLDRQWAPWIATWDIDWVAAMQDRFHWDPVSHVWSVRV